MTTTLALAAPVTAVGGIILAVRQDGGLAWLLAVALPVLVLCLWGVVLPHDPGVPAHAGADRLINRVLREQITGIRVVRAFVREQEEGERFQAANTELTTVSLKTGRLMAYMFPIVLLIINGSAWP